MAEIARSHVGKRMSQIVVHGDTVYLAGQVSDDTAPDPARQTTSILAKIDRLLAEAGSDKTRLLSATIWLSDIRHFAAMNEIWDGWVAEGHAPARTCVETRLAAPHFLVEITVVAAR